VEETEKNVSIESIKRRRIDGPRRAGLVALAAIVFLLDATAAWGHTSLRPSRSSLERQRRAALEHDFTYIRDAAHLRRFVNAGYVVRLRGNADYVLKDVSFPYARPEVKLFVERLSRQYRTACSEKLVVTSLTRPKTHRPKNGSRRSVHPTGMALDLRRSNTRKCRRWIEKVLLSLERKKVLEATRERRPPHYHVALFPKPYARYVKNLQARSPTISHRVARGETLWEIARRYRSSTRAIMRVNGLRSSKILPGQVLRIPR